ncbi:MAG: hypothetical protein [Circular genetic element sp.]|nr:MAG: hypothetical protein [Circular genetic element sp.]
MNPECSKLHLVYFLHHIKYWNPYGVDMAKNSGDVILRDRMQFELDPSGDRTTLYGRIDLSAYVNPVERSGLAVKQMFFQLRSPSGGTLTGVFDPVANSFSPGSTEDKVASLKMWLSTRAYENAVDVGIASPDVLCVYERSSIVGNTVYSDPGVVGTSAALINEDHWYGPEDLHPNGYTVVSDLLVGIAAEQWLSEGEKIIELDVVLIAEPIKVTTERMNEILSQAQDL